MLYMGTNMVPKAMQHDPFQGEDLGLVVNLLRSTIQKHFIVNDV